MRYYWVMIEYLTSDNQLHHITSGVSKQAYIEPHSNFSTHMTVCVSRVYHPHPRWMITSQSCDPRHGWRSEFSFYVASAEQQHSR